MELIRVIMAGILGTVLMTSFSYVISRMKSQQFKEPKLLNMILRRSTYDMNPSNNSVLGWVVHFSIGVILMTLFYVLHLTFSFSISAVSILIYGIIAGILSILSWHFMLSISSNSPDFALRDFYMQLLMAHVLFALGATIFLL